MINQNAVLKIIFGISVTMNVLLGILLIAYYFRNQDNIRQKIILATGNPEVIMFGDSHTVNAKWTSILKGWKAITMGYNGLTSEQLKNLLMTKVLPLHPKICFIQGGGADINSRCYDKIMLISNLQTMIDSLQSQNIQPVLQSLFMRNKAPEYNQEVDSINLVLRQLAFNKRVAFLDVNASLVDKNGLKQELTTDNIHLNEKGYSIWSEMVKKYLESLPD
jgi:lysophospholipase L1-like esterase